MPDENGAEFISSGDARVDAALARLRERSDARFKDLEDALLVQIHLERKQVAMQDTRLRDAELVQRLHQNALARHQEWLEFEERAIKRHEERLAGHEKWLAAHERAMSNLDIKLAEITDKVHFLIDREIRREGGPEAV